MDAAGWVVVAIGLAVAVSGLVGAARGYDPRLLFIAGFGVAAIGGRLATR